MSQIRRERGQRRWSRLLVWGVLGLFVWSCKGEKSGEPTSRPVSTTPTTQTTKKLLQTALKWGETDPPMPRYNTLIFKAGAVPEALQAIRKKMKQTIPVYRPKPPPRVAGVPRAARQSLASTQKRRARRIKRYFRRWKAVRWMIQTDKPLYRPGETIWFRAQAIYLQKNALPQRRGRVRCKLLTPRNNTLRRARMVVRKGHGHLQFKLPRNVNGGEYTLRFDDYRGNKLASKKITVRVYRPPRIKKKLEFLRKGYGPGDMVEATIRLHRATGAPLARQPLRLKAQLNGKTFRSWRGKTNAKGLALITVRLPKKVDTEDGLLIVQVREAGVTETISRPIPLLRKTLQVGFFPEGGKAALGLPSRVYYAARRNTSGKPVDLEGVIEDNQGNKVATIRSFHDGMGRFVYTPQPKKRYRLRLTRPLGIKQTFPLPRASTHPLTIQAVDDFRTQHKDLRLFVHSRKEQTITVSALQYETLIGEQTFSLRKGRQLVTLPLEKQWRGIVRVSLWSKKRRPLAERLLFRHRGRGLQLSIIADKKKYQPRQTVQLKVKATLPDGSPLAKARLGMAVVDDTVLSFADDHEPHFVAQRFLTGQLVGKIHKPNFYFDAKRPKAPRALDLVMGTHGWRDFRWRAVWRRQAPPSRLIWRYRYPLPRKRLARRKNGGTGRSLYRRRSRTRGLRRPRRRQIRPRPRPRRRAYILRRPPPLRRASPNKAPRPLANNKLAQKAPSPRPPRRRALPFKDTRSRTASQQPAPSEKKKVASEKKRDVLGAGSTPRPRRDPRSQSEPPPSAGGGRAKSGSGRGKKGFKVTRLPGSSVGRGGGGGLLRSRRSRRRYRRRRRRSRRRYRRRRRIYARAFPTRFYKQKGPFQGLRSDFRDTIYWNPKVVTDRWGEAKVSFGLNDSITSFRVTVAGVGGGRVGRQEKVISSSRPFFMTVKAPLETSAGDAMVLPLTLRNDSDRNLTLKVVTHFARVFRLEEDPLPSKFTLPRGEARTYFYPVRVVARKGRGLVVFATEGEGLRDAFQQHITIRPRGFPRYFARAGMIGGKRKKRTFRFNLPQNLLHAAPRTYAYAYPNPLGSLARGLTAMLREPHGCFEQASSSNYPNVLIVRYLRQKKLRRPALYRRAYGMMRRGYRKLLGYEVQGGGYSLFGSVPSHEALTAYGLLQFNEMKAVYPAVSRTMIRRTANWLRQRRDGKGGYKSSHGSGGHFGATRDITNAYITFALAEAGRRDINQELRALEDKSLGSRDPYLVSLVLNAILKKRGRRDRVGRALLKKLRAMQRKDGSFRGKRHSITRSYGKNLHLETTALATLALLRARAPRRPIYRAIRWMRRQRSPHGSFGATQATILVLRALLAYERRYPLRRKPGTFAVSVNGQKASSLSYKANASGRLYLPSFARLLRPGTNTVHLQLNASRPVPYSLGLRYYTRQPVNQPGLSLSLQTRLSKTKVRLGEVVRLSATLQNTTKRSLPMILARIAYPGAFRAQMWQLKELREKKKVASYETRPREVILYLRGLPPRGKKTIHFDLIAHVTGNYNSAASRAYLYYTNNKKAWTSPLRISVQP